MFSLRWDHLRSKSHLNFIPNQSSKPCSTVSLSCGHSTTLCPFQEPLLSLFWSEASWQKEGKRSHYPFQNQIYRQLYLNPFHYISTMKVALVRLLCSILVVRIFLIGIFYYRFSVHATKERTTFKNTSERVRVGLPSSRRMERQTVRSPTT